MPNQIAEMRKSRLGKSFVYSEIGCAKFRFEFERIDIKLSARHDAKAHCRGDNEVRPSPAAKRGTNPRCVLDEGGTVLRQVQLLLERPIQVASQMGHQVALRKSVVGLDFGGAFVLAFCKKYLAALTTQTPNLPFI